MSSQARVLVVLVVLLAGAICVGAILLGTGALDRTVRTTRIVERQMQPASGATDAPSVRVLYRTAAASVVDITSHVEATVETPFGERTQAAIESGTGSVLDAQGHILTAQHVVSGASSVSVKLADGTRRSARVLGQDRATDVAVLKIDPAGLTLHAIALGTVRSLAVGDPLFVIGDPFGYPRSLSSGLVSGLDRTIVAPNGFQVAHAIQTDAALNPGNSGGPVLDAGGRMVGVADQIATGSSAVDVNTGVGFAVAIDVVRSVLPQLERGETPTHAYIGVGAADSTSSGALVHSVAAGGPAAKAGVRTGDRIVAIDGAAIAGASDLVAVLASHRPGDRVTLSVVRGSSRRTLKLTLVPQPATASSG